MMDGYVLDAWLLEAVAWGPKWADDTPERLEGRSLAEVLGAGDAIGHAILARGEIEVAAGRLRAAALLWIYGARFTLTAAGQRLAVRARSGTAGNVRNGSPSSSAISSRPSRRSP
jgi:hypothetical protein